MFQIDRLLIENKGNGVITDAKTPHLSFSLTSDRNGAALESYRYEVFESGQRVYRSENRFDGNQVMIPIEGVPFKSDTRYSLSLHATSDSGEADRKEISFYTAKLDDPWAGKWIGKTVAIPKKSSPAPLLFKKEIEVSKAIKSAYVHLTSIGINQLFVNHRRIGDSYFAPGFTDYRHQIQYLTYRNIDLTMGRNVLEVIVAPGWAVGAFTYARKNAIYSDTQKLLFELIIEYADGSKEAVGSDESWEIATNHHLKFADFYDGEIYDARERAIRFEKAEVYKAPGKVKLIQEYGAPVKAIDTLEAKYLHEMDHRLIYDFGQNFAGVVEIEILEASAGQEIEIRHAEVLKDGDVFTRPLRSAKARVVYVCKDGRQKYSPLFSYMGFRYISISGIAKENIKVKGLVLSSDLPNTGQVVTSDKDINRLIQNIYWSGRSNFVDIPTDCPQRDERMGWMGDIAIFASTGCFVFDMSRFFDKWLIDMNASQSKGGGIRWTIPYDKAGVPNFATSVWGDAAVLVPYETYRSRGDIGLLKRQYPHMKRFVDAERFWARLFSFTKAGRHILKYPFQFGDWCAPNEEFKQWTHKGPWIATCYYANSAHILSKAAAILGYEKDAAYYDRLYESISEAFEEKFLDEKGQLHYEFQTGYALALSFLRIDEPKKRYMAHRLAELIKENNYHLSTGFPGTPQLLFALYDHGEVETARRLLLQDTYPSWLYQIKKGATSIWERWDAIREDDSINLGLAHEDDEGGMVSFNHYSYGSVGDFIFKRVGGLTPIEGGYRRFRIDLRNRLLDKTELRFDSPYGQIEVICDMKRKDVRVLVPVSTHCLLVLPNAREIELSSGRHAFSEF